MEREVIAWNPPIEWVGEMIKNAGTRIGSVYFRKRSDGKLRKMSYRLHVTNPSVAVVPKGVVKGKCSNCDSCGCHGEKHTHKDIDKRNNQVTVFDTNKVVRDKDGKVIGRGAWRCVPLENVIRIKNCGTVYTINRGDMV